MGYNSHPKALSRGGKKESFVPTQTVEHATNPFPHAQRLLRSSETSMFRLLSPSLTVKRRLVLVPRVLPRHRLVAPLLRLGSVRAGTSGTIGQQHIRTVDVDSDLVHPPLARYVHANVVAPGTQLVVLSGQLGLTTDGTIPQGVEAQTTQCFQNIAAILDRAGASLTDIVKLQAYVTDRTYLQGYMKARDAFLEQHKLSTPTYCSTLMIVSGFANEQYVVEVEATAAIPASALPGSGSDAPRKRRIARDSKAWNQRRAPWNRPKQRRHYTSTPTSLDSTTRKPDQVALAAFTSEIRAQQIHAVAATDEGEDARIEIARKSRDYFFYSPM